MTIAEARERVVRRVNRLLLLKSMDLDPSEDLVMVHMEIDDLITVAREEGEADGRRQGALQAEQGQAERDRQAREIVARYQDEARRRREGGRA